MDEKNTTTRWSEIEPLCILHMLLGKLWLLVLAFLIGVMAASIVQDCLITYEYSSSATFAVSARNGNAVYGNTIVAEEVVTIYSELLQSRFMDEIVQKNVEEEVDGTITATQLEETNLIQLTVTSASPKDALLIMQTVLAQYGELSEYISSTAVLMPLNTPNVAVTSTRTYSEKKVCLAGGVLCVLAMAAILIWIHISLGTIQTPEGAKNNLDARIIVEVPHESQGKKGWIRPLQNRRGKRRRERTSDTIFFSSPTVSFAFSEAIHRITSRMEHAHAAGKTVFLFSSVSEAEGKSTLAVNAAQSLAGCGERVLFLDLDFRRPVQSARLGMKVKQQNELGAMLAAGNGAQAILEAAVTDRKSGMQTLLNARSYQDMVDLLSSPVLEEVLVLARERFDYVIIDSSPMGYFADSEVLSELADAAMLVVRQDIVPAPEINDAIDSLRAGKAEFLGCILNDMHRLHVRSRHYGYDYGYGKYGRYGKYGKYSNGRDAKAKKE